MVSSKPYRERMLSDPVTAAAYLAANRVKSKTWRDNNPEKNSAVSRRSMLKRKYGLTPEQWEAMFERQGRKCAICRDDRIAANPRACHTDHCHSTGTIRGVLCHLCNRALGHAKDNPTTLRAMAAYLELHQENPGTPNLS